MKEYIAETGGRYTYSDDILNLQELALSMSAVFVQLFGFHHLGLRAGRSPYLTGICVARR